LTNVILQLKSLGIVNIVKFDFLSSPPSEIMIRSLELLYSINAIDDNSNLTDIGNFKIIKIGKILAELPIDPKIGTILLKSIELKCSEQILIIASMLSVQNIFVVARNLQDKVENSKKSFSVIEGKLLINY
jgi:ATP-dependent RNA helicase DDX35